MLYTKDIDLKDAKKIPRDRAQ